MQLTLDNLDGLGPVDYTAALDRSQPLQIERTLNAPSLLKALLCLAGSPLRVPARRARIIASSNAGVTLFTGYLTTEPVPIYAGEASQGAVYRLALSAVSDEWLLDKQSLGAATGPALGALGGSLVHTLAQRLDGNALVTSSLAPGRSLGFLEPASAGTWSGQAGAVAASTYAAYRALGGVITLSGAGSVQHPFSDGDGSLTISSLKTASVRELANDVTVSGAEAPNAYFTELFVGDGTTTVFDLLGDPAAPNQGRSLVLSDSFNETTLDLGRWQLSDPGSHLGLAGSGFAFTGGNGLDGQTTLTAWDPLELGGTLVFELAGVTLAAGSAGVLGGLYNGATLQANCFAGFNVRQAGGNTLVTPLVNGVEAGASLTLLPGHLYTLRIHLHCPELLRLKQTFYALTGTGGSLAVQQFGGGSVEAPVSLVFEARDQGVSSNTPVSILYDGTVSSSPAQAGIVPVNSLTLNGSIASLSLTRTGSCSITSTTGTLLAGKLADGVDFAFTSPGKITFFPGRAPAAGATFLVHYRGRQRAVARIADPVSLAAESAGGAIGSARWLGHVSRPPARSAEDCENAAAAILSFATNRSAAVSGTYTAINPPAPDVWPGDVLVLSTQQETLSVIARRVTLSEQGAAPEVLTCHIAFANDWAEGLGLQLSEAIAADALLPTAAIDLVAGAVPLHTLANLQQITVSGPAAGFLNLDAGLAPPPGGGFEVRRRDGGFGPGTAATSSGDLVLRSPVRAFAIPLSAQQETFFLRMYDASTPPLYSRCSAAIVTHLPAS